MQLSKHMPLFFNGVAYKYMHEYTNIFLIFWISGLNKQLEDKKNWIIAEVQTIRDK